jgi:hypothetical protein
VRTIEPHRVVPALHDQQAVRNLAVTAPELDGDRAIGIFLARDAVDRTGVVWILFVIAFGIVEAERSDGRSVIAGRRDIEVGPFRVSQGAATSAIELSDCRIRRARMVVIGSMVSSLSFLSRCEPDAALHQPSCPIFKELAAAFDRFYFSLYFKHKRNLLACGVQFVPNVALAGLSRLCEKYRRFATHCRICPAEWALRARILASQSQREE